MRFPVSPPHPALPELLHLPQGACVGSVTSHGCSWPQFMNREQGTPPTERKRKGTVTPKVAWERPAEPGGQGAVTHQCIVYGLDSAYRKDTLRWI